MGYTHYWRQSRSFTDDEWTRLTKFAKRLFPAAEDQHIIITGWDGSGGPEVGGNYISFNGNPSHETCKLMRVPTVRYEQEEHFAFCKTACKPYDIVVVTLLATAKAIAPDAIHISSDGGPEAFSPLGWLQVDEA